jgi:chromosome partitioning protein
MARRKAPPAPAGAPRPFPRILAIANNKGGVGKTTTTMNLAGALVVQKQKVLAIDLDPQCNASMAFNVSIASSEPGVRHLLTSHQYSVADCAYDRGPYCDFIPADPDLADLQTRLLLDPKGRLRLRDKLQQSAKQYNFVLLDCPPDVGALTQSALVAATEVIIPVDVGFFSVAGLARMVAIIGEIRDAYNPDLKITGVLATKFDGRTTLSDSTIAAIQAQSLPLFDTKIRISVDIIRAQMERMPVNLYAEGSHAATDYDTLAAEILPAKVIPLRRRKVKAT